MTGDSIQDSTRVVVDGARHGGVLPGTRAEMWRDVYLVSGADVRGPVWGNVVEAEGPGVRVRESVYARGPVRVVAAGRDGARGSDVSFDGCVTTPDAVQVAEAPFRTRFRANVYAGTVHLHNTIVYGNVYARSAVIRNSVILGGVFVAGRLTVADSVLSTFRARVARLEGVVSLLFPVAVAEEPMQLTGDLRALSFWSLDPARRGAAGRESGVVSLSASDVHAITGRLGDEEPRTYHVLSLDERILDTEPLLASLRANRRAIEGLSMLGQLSDDDARDLLGGDVGRLEQALFELVRRRDLPPAAAKRQLAEVAARADVLGALREYLSPEIVNAISAHGVGDGGDAAPLDVDCLPAELAALFEPGVLVQEWKPVERKWPAPSPSETMPGPLETRDATIAVDETHGLDEGANWVATMPRRSRSADATIAVDERSSTANPSATIPGRPLASANATIAVGSPPASASATMADVGPARSADATLAAEPPLQVDEDLAAPSSPPQADE